MAPHSGPNALQGAAQLQWKAPSEGHMRTATTRQQPFSSPGAMPLGSGKDRPGSKALRGPGSTACEGPGSKPCLTRQRSPQTPPLGPEKTKPEETRPSGKQTRELSPQARQKTRWRASKLGGTPGHDGVQPCRRVRLFGCVRKCACLFRHMCPTHQQAGCVPTGSHLGCRPRICGGHRVPARDDEAGNETNQGRHPHARQLGHHAASYQREVPNGGAVREACACVCVCVCVHACVYVHMCAHVYRQAEGKSCACPQDPFFACRLSSVGMNTRACACTPCRLLQCRLIHAPENAKLGQLVAACKLWEHA